jgi:hypothetical protein
MKKGTERENGFRKTSKEMDRYIINIWNWQSLRNTLLNAGAVR